MALSAGQTLRIPAGVVRNTFNAATITPTDPADTLGDVNPTTPQAAPPKKQKCGVIGQILLVVIAVVVTLYLGPKSIAGISNLITGATGAAAATAATVTAGTATLAAGSTVIGSGLAAAAGSIVSQAVGVATGIQEKFSWKEVGMAFISGGLAGGATTSGSFLQKVTRAMVRSAVSQGIGVTLGLQDKFSWAAVAAAGVGSAASMAAGGLAGGASNAVSRALGGTEFAAKVGTVVGGVVTGMADAMGNAAARSLIEGTDFGDNVRSALPSVLGNAIAGGFFAGDGQAGASEDNGGNFIDRLSDGLLAGTGNVFQGISSAVAGAAKATGDLLGFDGQFGYQGPNNLSRNFSAANIGQAFRGLLPVGSITSGSSALDAARSIYPDAKYAESVAGSVEFTLTANGVAPGDSTTNRLGIGANGGPPIEPDPKPVAEYDPTPRLFRWVKKTPLIFALSIIGSPAPHPSIEQANKLIRRVNGNLDHLSQSDLAGAKIELSGGITQLRPDGKPFNHVREVLDAQHGLRNSIVQINRTLSNPNTPAFVRGPLTDALSAASRRLDHSYRYVPRGSEVPPHLLKTSPPR